MADFPNVHMTDSDGNIGTATTVDADKVCGLLFDISQQTNFWTAGAGSTISGDWKDKIIEINSLQDAVDLGITPYSDEDGSTNILAGIPYYHIKHFFDYAGGTGRLFVAFVDCTTNWDAIIDMQRAACGMISQFGVWTEKIVWSKTDSAATTYTTSIINELNSVADEMANKYFSPASIILTANTSKAKVGNETVNTINFGEIPDAVIGARYVTHLISQDASPEVRKMQGALTSTTPVGCVGLALGALTRANVGESIGWVRMFDLAGYINGIEMGFGNANVNEGLLANSTSYNALSQPQLASLNDKGYMFLRTYEGKEGHFYFTVDHTCSNGDYNTIARNRTINKSRRLVRSVLLPFINSPVKVDAASGNLTSATVTIYRNAVTNALASMVSAEEVSAVGNVNIPANQNVLQSRVVKLSYTIVPLGCNETIKVTEGLTV